MSIRPTCVSMCMAIGILLFTGGPLLADQSKNGTSSQSGSTAERSAKQGQQESSGKMRKDSLGRPSGEATNPGVGTANGSDFGAGARSGTRGDTTDSPGGTSSGTESGVGTASPGVPK